MEPENIISHTFRQTERYFLYLCEAVPIPKEDERMRRYLLTHPHTGRQAVRGYALPRCDKNGWIYQREEKAAEQYLQKKRAYFCGQGMARDFFIPPRADPPEILFFFDPNSGQITAINGGRAVAVLLTVYKGVTQEQVREAPYMDTVYREAWKEMQQDQDLFERYLKIMEKF